MNCILTGKNVEPKSLLNHHYYTLNIADNEVEVFVCKSCLSRGAFDIDNTFYPIVEGLIANGKWPNRCEIVSETCDLNDKITNGETIIFPDYLQTADYPKTPKEKLDHLLLSLFQLQSFDGETFELALISNKFLLSNYFKNLDEGLFYVSGLKEQSLVSYVQLSSGGAHLKIRLTHKGLNRIIELSEDGDKSNKCFIAMSFNPSMKPIREAIRAALNETGYEAIIIDEQNVDSDKTINDEIIASLKKCKFCIADFSFHSNGVYFESGFALGQGKKVIYTCSKEEFEKAHFDIKPLQHIIHESPEHLKRALINKIEAYIN